MNRFTLATAFVLANLALAGSAAADSTLAAPAAPMSFFHPVFEVQSGGRAGWLRFLPHDGPSRVELTTLDGHGDKGVGGAGNDDGLPTPTWATPGPLGFTIAF